MISVDNFYWVLFENLMRPCELDAKYFFPFGTLDNVSYNEFNHWDRRTDHHVLFADQEPLYPENLQRIDEVLTRNNWLKTIRIVANSEISDQKKKFFASKQMLDWYFFYHGFAALDWFRDSEFISYQHDIKNCFLSLNHLVKNKRSYRMALLARLFDAGCAALGTVSFHGTQQDLMDELHDCHSELSPSDRVLIGQKLLQQDSSIPLIVDNREIDGSYSARFGFHEHQLWQNSLWHIVSETVFYDQKLHLTEKIFKPIVAQRPFVLVAAPGNLSYLKRYGFKTFDRWIDEGYDDIADNDRRLDHIVKEVARLSRMSMHELRCMHHNMQEILQFNKQHFFGDFKKIIVDELIDNFDQCLRSWNNGRVNYAIQQHPDLGRCRDLLLS